MTPTVLGISDDVTQCQQCGKTGLKSTVALDYAGEVRYLGRDCAGAAVFGGGKSRAKTAQAETIARDMAKIRRALAHPRRDWEPVDAFGCPNVSTGYVYVLEGDALRVQLGDFRAPTWVPVARWSDLQPAAT